MKSSPDKLITPRAGARSTRLRPRFWRRLFVVVVLVLSLLCGGLWLLGPSGPLGLLGGGTPQIRAAQVPAAVDPSGYRYRKIFSNITVLRNGTLDVTLELDLQLTRDLRITNFTLPYAQGQGLALNALSVTELGESGTGTVYTGREVVDLAVSNQMGSFQILDNGRSVDVQLLTSAPQGSIRRVRVNFLIYQASTRYIDVAETSYVLLSGQAQTAIDLLGVRISYEGNILQSEISSFRFFEHHSLETADSLLTAQNPFDFANRLAISDTQYASFTHPMWTYLAENVPARTRVNLRLVSPSVWLPQAQVQRSGEGAQLPRMLQEEEAYTRGLLQRFEYRVILDKLVLGLLAVALILLLIMHRYNIMAGYRFSRQKVTSPPEQTPPGLLCYLAKERVNARVILSTVYRLLDLGFLQHDGRYLKRVAERLLPADDLLFPYESAILHFVWNLMDGETGLLLSKMDQLINESLTIDRFAVIRIRNLLDAEGAARGLVSLADERKPAIDQILAGLLYTVMSILFCVIGRYTTPLLLLLPAATFFALAIVGARLTALGRKVLVSAQAYSRYLSEIDRQGLSSWTMLDLLDRDFTYSIALGVEKNFLTNVRYVISLEEMLQCGFFKKYGFSRMQNVVEVYLNRRGSIKARYLRKMVSYMYRRVQIELAEWQSALVRLNLLREPKFQEDAEAEEA